MTSSNQLSEEPQLRIALTLPGGVAPGTFEAGAVCALLAWTQEVNARRHDSVVIDVIAGASAGALTAVLAARVILAGDDPIAVLRRAWVAEPSLRALRATGPWAPLSLRRARAVANVLLFAPSTVAPSHRQATPVKLNIALGCLRGFSYDVPQVASTAPAGAPLPGAEYLDWSVHVLQQIPAGSRPEGSHAEHWRDAVASALASASHPLAFSAALLNREHLRAQYTDAGVTNLPENDEGLQLWYTDGGLLDNEPLGRCLKTVAAVDTSDSPSRLVMLVRSFVRRPPARNDAAWAGPTHPRFTQTLVRAFDLLAAHSLAYDLVNVEKVNARLRWTREVAAKISALLGDDRHAQEQLSRLLMSIQTESEAFAGVSGSPVGGSPVGGSPVGMSARATRSGAELVEALLMAASGLEGKRQARVAVVTPDPAFAAPAAERDLRGFVVRRQRAMYFAAGYWSMLKWIQEGHQLEERLTPELVHDACSAAERKLRKPRTLTERRSDRIPIRVRAEAVRLGARAVKISIADAVAAWQGEARGRGQGPVELDAERRDGFERGRRQTRTWL